MLLVGCTSLDVTQLLRAGCGIVNVVVAALFGRRGILATIVEGGHFDLRSPPAASSWCCGRQGMASQGAAGQQEKGQHTGGPWLFRHGRDTARKNGAEEGAPPLPASGLGQACGKQVEGGNQVHELHDQARAAARAEAGVITGGSAPEQDATSKVGPYVGAAPQAAFLVRRCSTAVDHISGCCCCGASSGGGVALYFR